MERLTRVAVAGVLVAGVLLSGVYYDAAEDRHDPHPDVDRVGAEYEAFVGETTRLDGEVLAVDRERDTATVAVEYVGGTVELTVEGVGAPAVERGGVVQVYGELRPDRTIAAERVVVVNPSDGSAPFKYAVSTVGAALVLAVFHRYWRVDLRSLTVEAR